MWTLTTAHYRTFLRHHLLGELCWLCRRSSHGDSSPSLRLFALGLRANKCRLIEPCCLGGSPLSFIDQARSVLLFVLLLTICRFLLSAARRDISFCFLIFLFSFASPCGRVLFCCWSHVFLFSCLLISGLLYSCPVCAATIAGPPVRVYV